MSEGNESQEVEAGNSVGNSSQEVEVNGVNSDEDIEENDDVFQLRANTTPVASLKSCNNEVPVYVAFFGIFTVISCRRMYMFHLFVNTNTNAKLICNALIGPSQNMTCLGLQHDCGTATDRTSDLNM